jgi:hypothetical protein
MQTITVLAGPINIGTADLLDISPPVTVALSSEYLVVGFSAHVGPYLDVGDSYQAKACYFLLSPDGEVLNHAYLPWVYDQGGYVHPTYPATTIFAARIDETHFLEVQDASVYAHGGPRPVYDYKLAVRKISVANNAFVVDYELVVPVTGTEFFGLSQSFSYSPQLGLMMVAGFAYSYTTGGMALSILGIDVLTGDVLWRYDPGIAFTGANYQVNMVTSLTGDTMSLYYQVQGYDGYLTVLAESVFTVTRTGLVGVATPTPTAAQFYFGPYSGLGGAVSVNGYGTDVPNYGIPWSWVNLNPHGGHGFVVGSSPGPLGATHTILDLWPSASGPGGDDGEGGYEPWHVDFDVNVHTGVIAGIHNESTSSVPTWAWILGSGLPNLTAQLGDVRVRFSG